MPSPRFIVSHYVFAEHAILSDAEKEMKRLSDKFPKKLFKIYCVAGDFIPITKNKNRSPKDMRNKFGNRSLGLENGMV